jgi:DNA modification methylase
VKATVINGDSRCIKFPKVDMVMTSPPYVGLIDYHEQHRYAYELLGLSREGEPSEIGPAKRGSSQAAKQAYADGIADVLLHTLDHVTPNGVMVVVVGDRHDLYGSIAKRLGVRIEHILRRHVNRRTGRRSTDFYEQVIVWRKE